MQDSIIENAYRHCEQMARRHYENFPVASWFLPRRLRRPITAIYAFARSADDLADEGDMTAAQRIHRLDDYAWQLDNIDQTTDPVFIALAQAIREHDLPLALLHDLLQAFKLDVSQNRYARFADVLFYCRHSANPIGRLLLTLTHCMTEENLQASDSICTALQLINFYQDLQQDYEEKDRIYIAQEELRQFGVSEQHFVNHSSDEAMRALVQFQVGRARDMLLSGHQLGTILPGRMGFELRMIIAGGLIICDKLLRTKNAFARPRLNKIDWLKMFWRAATQG